MARSKSPGRLSRLARLGSLTSRVAGSVVSDRVRDLVGAAREDDRARRVLSRAEDVAATLGRLKGAAMKVGQQLAVLAEAVDLPPEVAQALGTLHAEAEPVPFPVIRADLEAELGEPLDAVFAWIDEAPLGTASLAQAHAARLPDGAEVVVKVRHAGVDDSVRTDLLALRGLLVGSRVAQRSKAELDAIFDELRERLEEELDYLQEAANLHAYREVFGDDPRVRIPGVHHAQSTERVIVMDRLHGQPVHDFAATATPAARQRAGQTLAELYYEQAFDHRMLHADPHPGNYLFEEDGTVGILDFGCVKRFDEFWIGAYARAALAVLDRDREAALAACVDLGAWDGGDAGDADALWGFLDAMGTGFRDGRIRLSEGPSHIEAVRPAARRLVLHPRVRAPRHLIMLHRSLAGLYTLSRTLETELDFGALLRHHAERAVARAEGRLAR